MVTELKQQQQQQQQIELNALFDKETTGVEEDLKNTIKTEKSDLLYTLELMLNDTNIKGKTILDNRQVTAISLMNMYGQIYDIPFLKEFVETWSRYRISGDGGRGRQDLIAIAQAVQLNKEKEHNNLLELLTSR